jgi:hypothetical protein
MFSMSKLSEELVKKYRPGIELLKEQGYYHRILSEIYYLIIYLDHQGIISLLSDNFFSDIQGVFQIFVRDDLQQIFQEMKNNRHKSLEEFLKIPATNLIILQRCTTNLPYQVKSILRMSRIKDRPLKSRYLEFVSRKLNGEIQEYYRQLTENYKTYFRKKFSAGSHPGRTISLECLRQLTGEYDNHFTEAAQRFINLSMALKFVRDLFQKEMEIKIRKHISAVFNDQQRLNKLIEYFINDLKRTIIQMTLQQSKNGKSFEWIEAGLQEFLKGERFETLLKKVINQTFSLMQERRVQI